MKIIIVVALCLLVALVAMSPLFSFAWFMAQRTFTACLMTFVIGFAIGRWYR